MARRNRSTFALPVVVVLAVTAPVGATPVAGKLELPAAPERPAPPMRGFTERVENPKKPIQAVNVGPQLLVVLESDNAKADNPGQVKWELVGDSFSRPIIGAPVGAQIVIKNTSHTARTLVAVEDPKLIETGLINPKIGERTFTVKEQKVFTIKDKDAPHLVGRVVVVATPYIAHVEVTGTTGAFNFGDVAEGSYKLRIYFKDRWLDQTETINVGAKGKVEPTTFKVQSLGATEKKK
jgi:hypothetical protein